ncbi:MAG: peptide-methionine (S)-S-oxide reductase MsrA [Saprospiraceae bacterium]|nr:peptide-methionine (S)-S-oxide reductase MsrA [Saprospiraceae bacterium]
MLNLIAMLVLSIHFSTNQNDSNMSAEKLKIADNQQDTIPSDQIEVATLGGGCFWCVEAVYQNLEGVYSVVSGYSGGTKETADYKIVSKGTTDHAEVAQIKFNPKVISYADILEIFWNTHDPTTLNRQGNDVGPQYRSAIFYHSKEQKQIAEQSKKEVATQVWNKPIVTEITKFEAFYEAEDYHQDYYKNVGDRNPYCTYIITPKVQKLKKMFGDKLKKTN